MPVPLPGLPAADDPPRDAVERERDFTRDASHELRTPLTVIRVASDLIAHDPGLSPASRRSLMRIQDAVAGMEAVIDALLFLARCEQVPLDVDDVVVRDVIECEIDRIRSLLQHKQLALQLDVQAEPVLRAPPRILQVMLGNLLANAVRFTDVGGVVVRLKEDCVEVEDSGIGMDAVTLARAFEPFYRGESERHVGSGLGLSIAHRLGQRCGWPLRLDSVPGRGTRACILFGRPGRD